jgi:hypothetical protein
MQMGVTESAVHKMVSRAMRRIAEQVEDEAAQMRALVLARLDSALHKATSIMEDADADFDQQLRAAQTLARIEAQRANILGLTKYGPTVNLNNVNVPPQLAQTQASGVAALEGATVAELLQMKTIMANIRQRREQAAGQAEVAEAAVEEDQ